MNKIVGAALLSLITGSTSLLFPQVAKADKVIYCQPVTENRVIQQSSANHPHAYADGYREGQQSARNREVYKPRTAGGEFARGFEDGYFNRSYTGQEYVAPNTVVQHTAQACSEDGYYTVAPAPAVIYSNPGYVVAPPPAVIYEPSPSVNLGLGFGFGYGRRYRW